MVAFPTDIGLQNLVYIFGLLQSQHITETDWEIPRKEGFKPEYFNMPSQTIINSTPFLCQLKRVTMNVTILFYMKLFYSSGISR